MYGALLLFENELLHVVAITFTSLILTELLMVGLTIRTWHIMMFLCEILSLAIYLTALVVLRDIFGENTPSSKIESFNLTPKVYCWDSAFLVHFYKNISSDAGLDKSDVRTPGTTRKRFWATRIRGLVAQCTTKISQFFF